MSFNQFKSYKERIFTKNENKNISFDEINIIPYPGETRNLFLVTFYQVYSSDSYQSKGNKSLLVQVNKDQAISIITED